MTTVDASNPITPRPASRSRVMRRFIATLFPFLPPPGRLAASALLAAVVVATAFAWAGGLGGAGIISGLRPVPLFAALALTGGTIAAAVMPRYTYRHLRTRAKEPEDDYVVFGSHIIFVVLVMMLQGTAEAASSRILAGVSLLGAVLWVVHEAVAASRAKRGQTGL